MCSRQNPANDWHDMWCEEYAVVIKRAFQQPQFLNNLWQMSVRGDIVSTDVFCKIRVVRCLGWFYPRAGDS